MPDQHSPRVFVGNATAVTIALYLRDRYLPTVAVEVPPLSPTGPPGRVDDAAEPSWEAWWPTVLAAEPGTLVPPQPGPLRDLYDRDLDVARTWGGPAADEAILAFSEEREAIGALIAGSGIGGSLETAVVSMLVPWAVVTSPSRLVVSTALLADSAGMIDLLRTQLAGLT